MIDKFNSYCKDIIGLQQTDNILLTVSGGADSMVMLDLFAKSNYHFAVAHCNFRLRGEESERDMKFVENYCNARNIKLYIKSFDTAEYAKNKRISIQMAARDLRYEWFELLSNENGYNYIATAHHLDDQAETFFINLIRGTGIAGLHGIKPRNGKLIRPLMFATREQIEDYATQNKVDYVDDSSNFSDKYLRNHIRHNIVPLFTALNSNFITNLAATINNIAGIEQAFKKQVQTLFKSMLNIEGDKIIINIPKLLEIQNLKVYLAEFLLQYDFNEDTIEKVYNSLSSDKTDIRFFSSSYKLLKDRNNLIISSLSQGEDDTSESFFIIDENFKNNLPINISFEVTDNNIDLNKESKYAFFDYDKLRFPLILRKWQTGDFFYPFGMKGKKLLSDYFTDNKFSASQKENTWILCSGSNIIWIVGHRSDNRYRVEDKTKKILTAKFEDGTD